MCDGVIKKFFQLLLQRPHIFLIPFIRRVLFLGSGFHRREFQVTAPSRVPILGRVKARLVLGALFENESAILAIWSFHHLAVVFENIRSMTLSVSPLTSVVSSGDGFDHAR